LFPAEETVLLVLVWGLLDALLPFIRIMDFNIIFNEIVVSKLCGILAKREGDLHVSEEGIVFVLDIFLLEGLIAEFLAILLMHVELLNFGHEVIVIDWIFLPTFLFNGLLVWEFEVHAVEPDGEPSAVRALEGYFNWIESGDHIQVILFKREEEDIRSQTEFELPCHDEVSVNSSDPIHLVFVHHRSDDTVAI
jgi:hypothetical protein